MKTFIAASLLTVLAGCATTAEKTLSLPQSLANLSADKPLSCQFQKTLEDGQANKTTQWYFWRSENKTENRDQLTNQGEVWTKDHAGRFFYTRIFYNEKVALDFYPADLASLDANPKWNELASLIDPDKLGKQLAFTGKETQNGLTVEHYAGQLKTGMQTEVDWLPSLKIASGITKKQPEGITRLTLSNCAPAPIFAVKPVTETELNSFRHIDFTDLGDMESDPMVIHLENLMGHQHEGH